MPSKKPVSKKRRNSPASKRPKDALPIFPLGLPVKRSSKQSGLKLISLWGDDKSIKYPKDRRRIRVMPNPMPEDIVTLLTVACSAYGGAKLATFIFETIKLWLDVRKARRVKIKKGDIEIEIQAGMTAKEIEKIIDLLVKKTRDLEHVKPDIILPRGVDRSIPDRRSDK